MSANLKKHLATLSKRGPHRVMVGDLSYAGIEGKVYTPAEGKGLPAIAFAHDWTKKVKDYHATLRHLASWGIVVTAPDTETGVMPNHRNFAADVESALQIATNVRMGSGKISVSPAKLGIVGHGMGGGVAALAAVDNDKVRSVAAVYPADTAPSAAQAARKINAQGLIIGSGRDDIFAAGNPAKLAYNWRGPVAYREIAKGTQSGFSEDTAFKLTLGSGLFQSSQVETARGLITGFLLATLNNESKYNGFAEPEATAKGVESFVGEELAEKASFRRDA
ncbi:dienelactone hydrolase family protein [Corynebacterium sp.]|uniref:poly(ethylene terephthalate) hydrolase family protein n=1 Tax=Corynebacterium sp. TaxID=1720 RepID=UPI0026DB0CB5|nr:dienelactone hydrolase family protein [Corynebacterium sp.]MDO5031264.1 dienelactone hydrolase family protein [Corynebacterium sp.]